MREFLIGANANLGYGSETSRLAEQMVESARVGPRVSACVRVCVRLCALASICVRACTCVCNRRMQGAAADFLNCASNEVILGNNMTTVRPTLGA